MVSCSSLDAPEDRRVRDLVAVEMKNRQHRAVARRIQKLIGVPTCRQGAGLALAVADHATGEQTGIIEYRSIRVQIE